MLPEGPGVYIFRDKDGNPLYVGKAKNLKERVKSYFSKGQKDRKTLILLKKIHSVEPILTLNEKEAFLLENSLIKRLSPPYNINLKDDKTYISLKITLSEEYPALYITRKITDDGSVYFGPYPHAKDVRETLRLIQSIYPLRRCKNSVFKARKRPCILGEIGRCLSPCTGGVQKEKYMEIVRAVIDFLSGKEDGVLKELETRIEERAKNWQFEEAQSLKEKYEAIKEMLEKQNVHRHLGKTCDVWAHIFTKGTLIASVLNFRKGVLLGKNLFKKPVFGDYESDEMISLLFQYYTVRPPPDEIILSDDIENSEVLEEFLHERHGRRIRVRRPLTQEEMDLSSLAIENLHSPTDLPLDEQFMRYLHLSKRPRRIEIYDCSHLFGSNPLASMVVFEDFRMKKEDYRLFNIRQDNPMDDISSLREVIGRRLNDKRLGPLPDLIVVDGGRAQLQAAKKVLEELGIQIDTIGIAKGRRGRREEDLVYLPLRKNPLMLPKSSPVYKKLLSMRDEAHRFALFAQRRRRKKDAKIG